MLQDAGLIRQVMQVIQFERRQFPGTFIQWFDRELSLRKMTVFGAGAFKGLHVTAGNLRPDHIPAEQIGALAHGMPFRLIIQQIDHLLSQRLRVTEMAPTRRVHRPAFPLHTSRVWR